MPTAYFLKVVRLTYELSFLLFNQLENEKNMKMQPIDNFENTTYKFVFHSHGETKGILKTYASYIYNSNLLEFPIFIYT